MKVLLQCRLLDPNTAVSDLAGLGSSPTISFSNKYPDDADIGGLRTTLFENHYPSVAHCFFSYNSGVEQLMKRMIAAILFSSTEPRRCHLALCILLIRLMVTCTIFVKSESRLSFTAMLLPVQIFPGNSF